MDNTSEEDLNIALSSIDDIMRRLHEQHEKVRELEVTALVKHIWCDAFLMPDQGDEVELSKINLYFSDEDGEPIRAAISPASTRDMLNNKLGEAYVCVERVADNERRLFKQDEVHPRLVKRMRENFRK